MTGFNHGRFAYQTPQGQFDRGELDDTGAMVGGELTSKSDLESLLPMFGACRTPSGGGSYQGSRFLPFNVKIGSSLGCEISEDDGIIINEIGMWRVEARTKTLVAGIQGTTMEMRLELFDPDGNFVDRKIATNNPSAFIGGNSQSDLYSYGSFVIDRPGYRFRVYQFVSGAGSGESYLTLGTNELSAQYVYNGTPRFNEEG